MYLSLYVNCRGFFSDLNKLYFYGKILVKFPIIKFRGKIRVAETDLFHAD